MSTAMAISVDPKSAWMEDAHTAISALATRSLRTGATFTADDLYTMIGQPDHSNWSGTAFTAAKRRGDIEPTGDYVKSQRRARRGSVIAVWRAAS